MFSNFIPERNLHFMKTEKLTIYYKPQENKGEYVKSFTLSFSRINLTDNTYKQKAILEHRSKNRNRIEKYNLKEFHIGANELVRKFDKFDFEKEYSKPEKEKDYFCITYKDKEIETSNYEEIKSFLEDLDFLSLVSITHKHYPFIKDMYEYAALSNILSEKMLKLNGKQMMALINIFKNSDPYVVFSNMNDLSYFLSTI